MTSSLGYRQALYRLLGRFGKVMLETRVAGPSGEPDRAIARASRRLSERVRLDQGRWLQIVNIGLMVAGLALGQGVIFAVQTGLLAAGEYALLSSFATHYSFAMLGIILVEAGATITLARAVVHLSPGGLPNPRMWQAFADTSTIRMLMALIVSSAAVLYAAEISDDPLGRWYAFLALPGLLLWSVNGVGLLDGLRLSGISGLTGSIAYVVNALGLLMASHRSLEAAGAIMGAAFSLGYLLTLFAQWAALAWKGWYPRFHRPSRAGLSRAFRDGLTLSFQIVPGQIGMRVQLVLSATWLGAETTAVFVYAKQIVGAATQVLQFVLRVEFPGLVERLACAERQGFVGMMAAQKMTLACALLFSIGTTLLSGLVAAWSDGALHRVAIVMVGFAPTILTLGLLQMSSQGLAALGAYAASAWAMGIGVAVGVVASCALLPLLHVFAFAAAEVILNLVTLGIGYRYLERARPARPQATERA
ncbi:MAG: hypothetical protein JHD07_06285 [Bradyrhizobium sp.]|uniref:hypothetical protein n=1 Tax=Bradyrhizobium sp. TaxID=376 RepID=UPI001A2CA582|nr:hypothetical protein [Bradyrhizobium sp.]MBJ7402918.1 hypothetical protein [Bradyrhizobium sp.]